MAKDRASYFKIGWREVNMFLGVVQSNYSILLILQQEDLQTFRKTTTVSFYRGLFPYKTTQHTVFNKPGAVLSVAV